MKLNINKNTTKVLIGLGAAFVGAVVGTIIDEESSEKTFTKTTNYYDYKIARGFADFGILTPDGYGAKNCNYYDYKIVKAFL